MKDRRMISESDIGSTKFIKNSLGAQALYMHLIVKADDDGFVSNALPVARMIGASQKEVDELVGNGYLLDMGDDVHVIKHWFINNMMRKETYKPTEYQNKRSKLYIKRNLAYTLNAEKGISLKGVIIPTVTNLQQLWDEHDAEAQQKCDLNKIKRNKTKLNKKKGNKTNKKEKNDIEDGYEEMDQESFDEAVKETAEIGRDLFGYPRSIQPREGDLIQEWPNGLGDREE